MSGPEWVQRDVVVTLQSQTVYEKGGQSGIRDQGLLDSALARPENLYAYAQPSLVEIAASYAYGLAKNHAFLDGNKRISFIVTELFLDLNGVDLIASDDECVDAWLQLAAGHMSESDMASWLHLRSKVR